MKGGRTNITSARGAPHAEIQADACGTKRRGVLRRVLRRVACHAVFRGAARYRVVEAAVLIARAGYFAVGAVAIVLESAK